MAFLGMGRGDNPIRDLTYETYRLPGNNGGGETHFYGERYGGAALGQNIQQFFSNPRTLEIIRQWEADPAHGDRYRDQLNGLMRQTGASLANGGEFAYNPATRSVGFRTRDINADYVYPAVMLATMALGGAAIVSAAGGIGAMAAGTGTAAPSAAAPAAGGAVAPGFVSGAVANTAAGLGGGAAAGGGAAGGAAGGGFVANAVGNTAAGLGGGAGAAGGAAGGAGGGMSAGVGGFSWSEIAQMGGSVAGQYAQNRQRGADRALTQQEIDLERQRLQIAREAADRAGRAEDYRQTQLGTLGRTTQDVSIDRSAFRSNVPTVSFTGGNRPSNLAPNVMNADLLRQMAERRLRQATPQSTRFLWDDVSGGKRAV